jgi:membrane protein
MATQPISGPPPVEPRKRPRRTGGSFTAGMRRVAERLAIASSSPEGKPRPLHGLFLGVRVLLQVIRQWARDRCPQQAASLAFQSALSVVPLVAIALTLLRSTGAFEAEGTLVQMLSRQVNPVEPELVTGRILEWSSHLDFRSAGLPGIVTTIVLSFVMYTSVEKIFNDIWRVERRRKLGQKFVVFYALVTLTPALLGASLYHAARYGLTSGFVGSLGALVATFGALFLANKLLPATRVSWRAAAVGALLSALAFEAAKNVFQLYVTEVAFKKYAGIYGTLGIVPIVLIWIYYSWLVVLLGAEVAHTIQHLQHLEAIDRRAQAQDHPTQDQVNGVVAARLYCEVVAHWRTGGQALPAEELADRFEIGEDVVERIFRRLKEARLVLEVEGDTEGYLPARAPTEVTLAEVIAPFRGGDVATVKTGRARLDQTLGEIEAAVRDRSKSVTIDELTGKTA